MATQPERLPNSLPGSHYHPAAHQDDQEGIRFELEPKRLNRAQKLATLLHLPALVLAIPIAIAFHANDVGLPVRGRTIRIDSLICHRALAHEILGFFKRSRVVPRICGIINAKPSCGNSHLPPDPQRSRAESGVTLRTQ